MPPAPQEDGFALARADAPDDAQQVPLQAAVVDQRRDLSNGTAGVTTALLPETTVLEPSPMASVDDEAPVLAIDAPGYHFSVRVRGTELTIGRGERNDVGLDLPSLSEHHAVVRQRGERWQIVDLRSEDGTSLDGQAVKEALLEEGDSFRLGDDVTVVFHRTAAYGQAPTAEQTAAAEEAAAAADDVLAPAPQVNTRLAEAWPEPQSEGQGDAATEDGPVRRTIPHPPGAARIRLGRAATNDLVLGSPRVSLEQAVIERADADDPWIIISLDHASRTFVNNHPVQRRQLGDGDVLRIGPYRLVVEDGEITYSDETAGILLQALNLTRKAGKKTILRDLSLVIQPHEFVAIVGVSGAGKTTLLNALSGLRPAKTGQVLLNGYSLYDQFDSLRAEIGYVPQDDIVHGELTVEKALDYAARLRMPADTSKQERAHRLDEVITELGLQPQRTTVISRLSGGQRKRVSIGVELLTKPPLFFLDEPTSGLDPVTASRTMDLLRQLADQGRTVLLVTHATRDISLCDKVVFLARGGRLAFFGTPIAALDYFGVAEFEDIYDQIENQRTAEEWEALFRESSAYQLEITTPMVRLQAATLPADAGQNRRRRRPGVGRPSAGTLRQFRILAQRYVDTMLRDRKHMLILLLQAPIIAVLLWGLFTPDVFKRPDDIQVFAWHSGTVQSVQRDANTGKLVNVSPGSDLVAVSGPDCSVVASGSRNPSANCHVAAGNGNNTALKAAQLAFLLAAVAVWLGTLNAVREISKEHAIYQRERMVNLRIIPYIASKFMVLFVLVVLQSAMLLGVTAGYIHFPTHVLAGTWLALLLGSAASVMVALAVSAAVSDSGRAIVAAPLLMVPQILFAGGLTPIQDLGVAKPLAALVVTRWCYEAIGRIFGVVKLAGIPEQFPQTPALSGQATLPWLVMAGFIGGFGVLAIALQKMKDRR